MLGIGGGGDAPEIEIFFAVCLGVENGGGEEGDSGGEVAIVWVGGGLHVVAGVLVVEHEAGGDYFVFVVDEVEGGEGLFELGF